MLRNVNLIVLSDELVRVIRERVRLLDVEFELCPELVF